MIVCTSCSHRNEDDDEFCGSCGKFLEWVGEKVVDPAPTAAVVTPRDTPVPPSTAAVDQPRAVEPRPKPAVDAGPATRAVSPVAQKPTRTVASPRLDPRASAPTRAVQPGERICVQCGAGNEPARSFCRRCGGTLANAPAAPKVPWYKRILARPVPRAAPAGTRSSGRPRGVDFRPGRLVALLALVGIIGVLVVPETRGDILEAGGRLVDRFQEVFGGYKTDPARAVTVEASSSVAGHEAAMVADLASNTFWAEGGPAEGIGQNISFNFGRAVNLADMVITVGANDATTTFVQQPRPRGLHIAYDTGRSTDVELKDTPEPQTVRLADADKVTVANVAITSVYPSSEGGQDTSITEIEFTQKG